MVSPLDLLETWQALHPSTPEAEVGFWEFEVSLVYIASSMRARVTQ